MEQEEGNEYTTKKINFSKAFAKDVFINQKQKLGAQKRVLVGEKGLLIINREGLGVMIKRDNWWVMINMDG
jgi:hypothetical protein